MLNLIQVYMLHNSHHQTMPVNCQQEYQLERTFLHGYWSFSNEFARIITNVQIEMQQSTNEGLVNFFIVSILTAVIFNKHLRK